MSLKNTATVDKIKPIPRVNMNKHINEKGNIKWYQLIPVPTTLSVIRKESSTFILQDIII